tara:strand:+ start:26 stop:493 length:468 start_codon:yes stop_codon:yes gene_type:complete
MKQLIKQILKEETSSNEQDIKAKQIVNRNLIHRLEELTGRGRINSYDELFFDIKRTVMKLISIIKDEFSVNSNELSIDKKMLLNYIERSLSNNQSIYRSIGRNQVGRLLNIINQELNRFKGTEEKSNDTDKDGIPNRLDIDDDNDGVLDPNDTDS